MEIKWEVKTFEELTVQELYGLLRLREQVFIIEQNCIYPDLDNKDPKALHILGISDDEIVSYSRIFKPGDYFDTASIGRVVTDKSVRNQKVGHTLMQKSIIAVEQYFGETTITISAQQYLTGFYESLGFVQVGEGYLEDDIPHIKMVKNK
jgi:ElaA protein